MSNLIFYLKALARRTATVPKTVKASANINSKYPVGVAQPAAVVGLLEAGVPKKNMPK